MPTATPTKPFALCPAGEDILVVLKSVEVTLNPPDAMYNPGAEQWRWNFQTTQLVDEEGEAFKLAYFTGTEYGSERAKLTKLLNKIAPNLTAEEKACFDTDTMVGKKFRLDVTHLKRSDGTLRAVIESIRRAPAAATKPHLAPAPVVDEDEGNEDGDPFAEE